MITQSEFIVGLWFVPVILCILVPLAMFSVYGLVKTFQQQRRKSEYLAEKNAETKQGNVSKKLQQSAAAN